MTFDELKRAIHQGERLSHPDRLDDVILIPERATVVLMGVGEDDGYDHVCNDLRISLREDGTLRLEYRASGETDWWHGGVFDNYDSLVVAAYEL